MELGGSSEYEEIFWQFPRTNVCPLDECAQSFSSASNCVEHFCEQHAVTAMLCFACKKIFLAEKLAAHYNTDHPDEASPQLKAVMAKFSLTFYLKLFWYNKVRFIFT